MKRRAKRRTARIIFVTGTDTGVGKTVFTSLLLYHLRKENHHALAMKPFCSGGRADVKLLRAMLDGELTEDEINPFYFPEAVAPLVSLRQRRRVIPLMDVVRRIRSIAARCDWLLIEGSGGLLVPLGENYLVRDLIWRLNCEVIVVARNRLGTINHTLLAMEALGKKMKNVRVALVAGKKDVSSATNQKVLGDLLAPAEVFEVEFLGENASKSGSLKKNYGKVKKTLARFCS